MEGERAGVRAVLYAPARRWYTAGGAWNNSPPTPSSTDRVAICVSWHLPPPPSGSPLRWTLQVCRVLRLAARLEETTPSSDPFDGLGTLDQAAVPCRP